MLPALKIDSDITRKPYETFAHFKIGNGHATLSIILNEGIIKAGIAYCSPKDRFNKARGRLVAKGRRNIPEHKFAFSYTRNDKPIIDQLREEFEKHATQLSFPKHNWFTLEAWTDTLKTKKSPLNAPRWAYKAILKDIERRKTLVVVDNSKAINNLIHLLKE